MNHSRRLMLILALSAAAATTACAKKGPRDENGRPLEPLAIVTASGEHKFMVEIADDDEARQRGLMFRPPLPDDRGMLFQFPAAGEQSFWMRNTQIALDMIFIDARGEVRHVHPMARPLDETAIPGAAPGDPAPERLMVLEVRGGDAARLGIHPGMVLSHPRLPQQDALAPCD